MGPAVTESRAERTGVLIVGGALVGLSAAMFLADRDVPVVVVERRPGSSKHPRATGFTARTLELFRSVGLTVEMPEGTKRAGGGPRKVRVQSLVGEWFEEQFWAQPGEGPPPAPVDAFSPYRMIGIAQDRLEPQLRKRAVELGADVRNSHELIDFEETAGGVVATIQPAGGPAYRIEADYLLAADGSHSPIREKLGIGRTGIGCIRTVRSVLFTAPLEHYLDSGFTQFTIDQPGLSAFLSTYLDGRWILMFSDDESRDDETLRRVIRQAIGDDDMDVELITTGRWEVSGLVADQFSAGRVFLAGDAAHTLPPNRGGYGANTGIDDVHNLAWKIAAVRCGQSRPELLDTYEAERRAIAQLRHDQIFIRDDSFVRPEEGTVHQVKVLEDAAMELGQLYRSRAVIGAGDELPPAMRPDQWHGQPGTRAPHRWLRDTDPPLSTLDRLTWRWTVVAASPTWADAAQTARVRTGIPLVHLQIGLDLTSDDDLQAAFGLTPGGAALVRPDGYIAWRSTDTPTDPAAELTDALTQVAAAADTTVAAQNGGDQ